MRWEREREERDNGDGRKRWEMIVMCEKWERGRTVKGRWGRVGLAHQPFLGFFSYYNFH